MLDRVTAQVWPVSGSNEQVRRQIEEVRQSPRLPGIHFALPVQYARQQYASSRMHPPERMGPRIFAAERKQAGGVIQVIVT